MPEYFNVPADQAVKIILKELDAGQIIVMSKRDFDRWAEENPPSFTIETRILELA